jgi:hypothetical protein
MSVPMEYLADPAMCSRNVLGEYQLLHLNRAAELEKEIRDLVRLYVEEMAAAGFALFMREHRDKLIHACSSTGAEARKLEE